MAKALTGAVKPLNFPLGSPIAAKETTEAKISLNLDARVPDATSTTPPTPRSTYGTSGTVYDSQGVAHQVEIFILKTDRTKWDVYNQLDDPTPVATPITSHSLRC